MTSLHIKLNGTALIEAGTSVCCSLGWSVRCSRDEEAVAYLEVNGMVRRGDDKYDHLYWIEDRPLVAGDRLDISCASSDGASPTVRMQTHEQLEDRLAEYDRAEKAGEYDALQATEPAPIRTTCALELISADGIFRNLRADGSVTTVVCEGRWTSFLRPEQWLLHFWSVPTPEAAGRFWQPIAGAARVTVRET